MFGALLALITVLCCCSSRVAAISYTHAVAQNVTTGQVRVTLTIDTLDASHYACFFAYSEDGETAAGSVPVVSRMLSTSSRTRAFAGPLASLATGTYRFHFDPQSTSGDPGFHRSESFSIANALQTSLPPPSGADSPDQYSVQWTQEVLTIKFFSQAVTYCAVDLRPRASSPGFTRQLVSADLSQEANTYSLDTSALLPMPASADWMYRLRFQRTGSFIILDTPWRHKARSPQVTPSASPSGGGGDSLAQSARIACDHISARSTFSAQPVPKDGGYWDGNDDAYPYIIVVNMTDLADPTPVVGQEFEPASVTFSLQVNGNPAFADKGTVRYSGSRSTSFWMYDSDYVLLDTTGASTTLAITGALTIDLLHESQVKRVTCAQDLAKSFQVTATVPDGSSRRPRGDSATNDCIGECYFNYANFDFFQICVLACYAEAETDDASSTDGGTGADGPGSSSSPGSGSDPGSSTLLAILASLSAMQPAAPSDSGGRRLQAADFDSLNTDIDISRYEWNVSAAMMSDSSCAQCYGGLSASNDLCTRACFGVGSEDVVAGVPLESETTVQETETDATGASRRLFNTPGGFNHSTGNYTSGTSPTASPTPSQTASQTASSTRSVSSTQTATSTQTASQTSAASQSRAAGQSSAVAAASPTASQTPPQTQAPSQTASPTDEEQRGLLRQFQFEVLSRETLGNLNEFGSLPLQQLQPFGTDSDAADSDIGLYTAAYLSTLDLSGINLIDLFFVNTLLRTLSEFDSPSTDPAVESLWGCYSCVLGDCMAGNIPDNVDFASCFSECYECVDSEALLASAASGGFSLGGGGRGLGGVIGGGLGGDLGGLTGLFGTGLDYPGVGDGLVGLSDLVLFDRGTSSFLGGLQAVQSTDAQTEIDDTTVFDELLSLNFDFDLPTPSPMNAPAAVSPALLESIAKSQNKS